MIDQRVRQLLRDNHKIRLHVLMVLWASVTPLSAKAISDELDCNPDIVENALPRMFAEGYISRWPDGRHNKWWLGDKAGQLTLPGLQLFSEGSKQPLSLEPEGSKQPLRNSEGSKQPLSLEPEGSKQPLSPSEISTFLGQVTDQGLMCLFVLWANPQPVTIGDIETITGVCRHTTSEALDRLKLHGYAAEVGGGRWPRWTLTDRGRQLSLPGLNAPGLAESDGHFLTITAPTTTTAILSPLDYVKAAAAESDGQKMTINPKLAAALKAAGIGSNAWPQLAKLEHVTPAYVKAHDAYRRECGESTGLLITRLKCGDPVPEKKRTPVRDGSDVAAAWQKFLDEPRDNKRRK